MSFNRFPWTNMHGFNLQWVIETVKELATNMGLLTDKVDDLEEEIDGVVGSIQSDYQSIEIYKSLVVDFGLETEDWSPAIQATLDNYTNAYIPFTIEGMYEPGNYYVRNTVTFARGQRLKGEGALTYPNSFTEASQVQITHEPWVLGNLFEASQDDLLFGYVADISIKDLFIAGGTHSDVCFALDSCMRLDIENVAVREGFNKGITVASYINSEIKNVFFYDMAVCSIEILEGVSTTTTFDRVWSQTTPIGVIINEGSTIGISFNNCIIEGSDTAYDIYTENIVNIENIYTENVPSDGSDASIIKVGVNGTPNAAPNTVVNITGGILAGSNAGIGTDSIGIECDSVKMLTVSGVEFARVNQGISNTVNSLGISLLGCVGFSVTLVGDKVLNKSQVTYNTEGRVSAGRLDIHASNASQYILLSENGFTQNDLNLYLDGNPFLSFDAVNNIKLNAHEDAQSVEGAVMIGAVGVEPTISDNLTDSIYLYALDVQGVRYPKIMSSGPSRSQTTLGMKGTTAQRPSPVGGNLEDGDMYFNTTTRKPEFFNASFLRWDDVDGVPV